MTTQNDLIATIEESVENKILRDKSYNGQFVSLVRDVLLTDTYGVKYAFANLGELFSGNEYEIGLLRGKTILFIAKQTKQLDFTLVDIKVKYDGLSKKFKVFDFKLRLQ